MLQEGDKFVRLPEVYVKGNNVRDTSGSILARLHSPNTNNTCFFLSID